MVGYISSLSLEPSYRNRLALGDDKKVRASEQSARREREKGWKEREKDERGERERKKSFDDGKKEKRKKEREGGSERQ